ncbi:MAG TPA: glycosyltransferase [Candidatus Polarisedimenticolia bacterium]|nr:glycosyltransferase [Candidatus Polarisedimenticolia bacterium]
MPTAAAPRALLVTQDLQRAGAQRQCVELAVGLKHAGWGVAVAVLEQGGPLEAELRSAGIPLHPCPRRWRWDPGPALALARLWSRLDADVVQTFLFLPNFYGRLGRLVRRPRLLVSSLRSTGIEGWPRYAAEVLLAPLCDLILANSEAGKSDLVTRGVAPGRIVVIRNGMTFERFDAALRGAPPPEACLPRLGMVAQMERRKDHLGLVEALVRVRARLPEARLFLAGDGSLRPAIEARVRERGLAGSVEFLGTVDRPEALLTTLAIAVQASAAEEGTSNSILEAMACGRPVVATDIGGNREVVDHGRTGFIVPARDPDALARALMDLLSNPERIRSMGEAAGASVRARFSREAMIGSTIAAYREMRGRAPRDAA